MLFYLLVYTFTTAGAFGAVLLLERNGREAVQLADYGGLAARHPVLAVALSVFLLSLVGIPPTAGFVGKFYLFGAAVKSGYVWLAVIGVLNSAVAAYYYLRLIVFMYMREPEGAPTVMAPSFSGALALVVALWGVVQLGVAPGPLFDLAQAAVIPAPLISLSPGGEGRVRGLVRPKLPYRGWLFDLDGTVYLGERLIPGADAAIAALRAAGRRVAFLTNKPLQTRTEYAAKLTRLGVPAAPDDVINSSLVLARYLRDRDPGAPVFVIGEPPMQEEMRAHGFEVRGDERVRWVVIAFDRTFDYAKLNTALQAVKQGARLIATNPDRTCPVEGGEIPDCAGMIAAVEAVTDRKVETIVGKPSPIILEVALAALGVPAGEAVMVGDRIDTDIVMGRRLGLGTVLVLSGVTRADDPRIAAVAPDHVVRSIEDLVE